MVSSAMRGSAFRARTALRICVKETEENDASDTTCDDGRATSKHGQNVASLFEPRDAGSSLTVCASSSSSDATAMTMPATAVSDRWMAAKRAWMLGTCGGGQGSYCGDGGVCRIEISGVAAPRPLSH